MVATTSISIGSATNMRSTQPPLLNSTEKSVLQVLSAHIDGLSLDEDTRALILALDTITLCGGSKDVFCKVMPSRPIYNHSTEEWIPEGDVLSSVFEDAKHRFNSTATPTVASVRTPLDVLSEGLSGGGDHAASSKAGCLQVHMHWEDDGTLTRHLVLKADDASKGQSIPFPLPEDLAHNVSEAYFRSSSRKVHE